MLSSYSPPASFFYGESFSKVSEPYLGFIVDLWGVVHNGVALLPYVETSHLWEGLVTSGDVTLSQIQNCLKTVGPCGFFLGQRSHRSTFKRIKGIVEVFDLHKADFIFNTGPEDLGQKFTFYLKKLEQSARQRTPMICVNPDIEVMFRGQRIVCAGALAKAYEERGGEVIYSGKPYQPAYDQALKILGNHFSLSQILALGDSLDTDVRGAFNAGMDSALLLTGIHGNTIERLKTFQHFSTEKALNTFLKSYEMTPTYVLSSLCW